ncbi:MAG TPA: N-succinylarginine dihydrolase [Chthoniobacterales bacterium]
MEVNFDGLVGPTHNFAGLSPGNIASTSNKGLVSNPREAALQGIQKMKLLASLGVPQAFLPPLERPSLRILRECGFDGQDPLAAAFKEAPRLLAAACSASSMWTANAATVAPSFDTADGKTHFTPANLFANFHRSWESVETSANLRRIFSDPAFFTHHPPLAGGTAFSDEGAANHTRLAPSHDQPGLHVFVYGFSVWDPSRPRPVKFVARQSLESCQTIARLHGLREEDCVFLQQNPAAIDAGVFHNDVIATGNENVMLYHDTAWVESIDVLKRRYEKKFNAELCAIEVPSSRVSIADAITSYLFNSQIVTLSPGEMLLVAPSECEENNNVRAFIEDMVSDAANPINGVRYLNLRGSMSNGGGPACLRLRVVLDEDAWRRIAEGVKITPGSAAILEDWVKRNYRSELRPEDLVDTALIDETQEMLKELTSIIGVGPLYAFQ